MFRALFSRVSEAALRRGWRMRGPQVPACHMCDGLYVRADGRLPCWCGPGEAVVHRRLEVENLPVDVANLPEIQAVRRSFAQGRAPFPGVCDQCQATRLIPLRDLSPTRRHLTELHLEPSFWCNLGCAMCPPDNAARRSQSEGDMNLSLPLARALFDNLKRGGIAHIERIRFEGKGDPLLNSDMEALVLLAAEAYPHSFRVLTTNGSFPRRRSLARCGLSEIVVSADGFFQESYAQYRVRGDINQVKAFVADLAQAPRAPRLVWKYILFEWNDSEAEMEAAWRFCRDHGVQLELRLTHSDGASLRYDGARLERLIRERLPGARWDATYLRQRSGETEGG